MGGLGRGREGGRGDDVNKSCVYMCCTYAYRIWLHVVPKHERPHVIVGDPAPSVLDEVAEDPTEVLLEVLLHHLLQQFKQPGLVLGVHQTIIVHTIDLRGEGEREEGERERDRGREGKGEEGRGEKGGEKRAREGRKRGERKREKERGKDRIKKEW